MTTCQIPNCDNDAMFWPGDNTPKCCQCCGLAVCYQCGISWEGDLYCSSCQQYQRDFNRIFPPPKNHELIWHESGGDLPLRHGPQIWGFVGWMADGRGLVVFDHQKERCLNAAWIAAKRLAGEIASVEMRDANPPESPLAERSAEGEATQQQGGVALAAAGPAERRADGGQARSLVRDDLTGGDTRKGQLTKG